MTLNFCASSEEYIVKAQGWLFLIIILLLGANALAQTTARTRPTYPFYRGIRQLGMGGAAVATVNDETALFLNPAGLGRIRGPIITLADPEIESSMDTVAVYRSPAATGKSLTDPQQLLDVMSDTENKTRHVHGKAQVFPSIVTTNFGFGVFGNYNLDAEMEQNTATPTYLSMDYRNDIGATLGYCLRLFDGRIKIGVAGKVVNRAEIARDIPTGSTGLTMQSLMAEGTGVGSDAGIMMTAPWAWLPTVGVAAHDMGNTNFNLGSGFLYKTGVVPNPQKQSVDAGISISPIHGNRFRSTWTAEYTNVQSPDTVKPVRRIHAGVEFNVADILFLRGGYNGGYYTGGLELSVNTIQFQVATYGEEVGTATVPKEDRRYTLKLAIRF